MPRMSAPTNNDSSINTLYIYISYLLSRSAISYVALFNAQPKYEWNAQDADLSLEYPELTYDCQMNLWNRITGNGKSCKAWF